MKKLVAFMLALVMVLCLCACNSNNTIEEAPKEGLEVGYGRVDVTPSYPVAIAGSATEIISAGTKDLIYVTFIALRYAEETFLVATMDFVGAYEEYGNPARARISQETGIPEDHIILNATHTHSSVSISSADKEGVSQYLTEFFDWASEAAKAAIADLSPAEVWYGSTQAEGMAWVRHYKMNDGTYYGSGFGSADSGIAGHAVDADVELQIIKFARPAEDKKDIVLMNFPAHATMQKEYYISADFPGPTRDYIAEQTDTLVAYFIAAAGNQTPTSKVGSEQFSPDYRVYGQELGRIAVECMNTLTKLETTDIRFSKQIYTAKTNKENLERLSDAQAVKKIWNKVGGRGTEAGKAAAKEYGFSSVYEVTSIMLRAGLAETRDVEMKTLAIGDVAFIFAPYEMFGVNSMYIKEKSPYPMTFIVSCSLNLDGYMPSEYAWDIMSYEAQITRYARGTAEKLAEEYVNMLIEMKAR